MAKKMHKIDVDNSWYILLHKIEIDVDNSWYIQIIVTSKLIYTTINSKYLTGYLDEVVRPLILILLKTSGYVKTFKDKNKKLIHYQKSIKPFGLRLKTQKDIELNVWPVYDERYITKKRTYRDIVYINFSWLKCARRWSKMQIFYNHFYLFFTRL